LYQVVGYPPLPPAKEPALRWSGTFAKKVHRTFSKRSVLDEQKRKEKINNSLHFFLDTETSSAQVPKRSKKIKSVQGNCFAPLILKTPCLVLRTALPFFHSLFLCPDNKILTEDIKLNKLSIPALAEG